MSMFRHQAIYNTHSNVVGVNEHRGAIDKDDNIVTLDETKIAEEEAINNVSDKKFVKIY